MLYCALNRANRAQMVENFLLDRPLRRSQAAQYVQDKWNLACSAKTLAKLACVGGGPLHRLWRPPWGT